MEYKVQVEDIEIQVYERGNNKSEIMIVFLHGGPGSGAASIMELKAFQCLEENYHCIYFDQRGSGKSIYDLKRGLPIEQITADVDHVIQDCKKRFHPKHLVLWGGSFGGALACLYMERFHDRVDCLLLSNPVILCSREQALSLYHRMSAPMARRLGLKREQSLDKTPEKQFQDRDFVEFIFSKQNSSNSLRHVQAMSSWFFSYDYRTALNSITVPCMVLNGEDDLICDSSAAIEAFQNCENDRFYCVALSNCGHAVFEDRREDFISLTVEFMENVLQ